MKYIELAQTAKQRLLEDDKVFQDKARKISWAYAVTGRCDNQTKLY